LIKKDTIKTATFSDCQRYRYQLERTWGERLSRKSTVVFVGLNPSTADASKDDPTIRKCTDFAQRWQFKKLIMVNLFAWRTTDPNGLLASDDPVGELNDQYLDKAIKQSSMVLACWGEYGTILDRSSQFRRRYSRRLHCLKKNASGEPTHPLYLPATLTPVKLTKK